MNNSIRAYMRSIGRKGGKAGKGSPRRIEANRRASAIRWRKTHPPPQLESEPATSGHGNGQ